MQLSLGASAPFYFYNLIIFHDVSYVQSIVKTRSVHLVKFMFAFLTSVQLK